MFEGVRDSIVNYEVAIREKAGFIGEHLEFAIEQTQFEVIKAVVLQALEDLNSWQATTDLGRECRTFALIHCEESLRIFEAISVCQGLYQSIIAMKEKQREGVAVGDSIAEISESIAQTGEILVARGYVEEESSFSELREHFTVWKEYQDKQRTSGRNLIQSIQTEQGLAKAAQIARTTLPKEIEILAMAPLFAAEVGLILGGCLAQSTNDELSHLLESMGVRDEYKEEVTLSPIVVLALEIRKRITPLLCSHL